MSEQGESPSEVAAVDQAVASARHAAECTVRFYGVLAEGNVPPNLAGDLTRTWLFWFLNDELPDEDDDDDE